MRQYAICLGLLDQGKVGSLCSSDPVLPAAVEHACCWHACCWICQQPGYALSSPCAPGLLCTGNLFSESEHH